MTIIGFNIGRNGLALAWADGEEYLDHRPCGPKQKLRTSDARLTGIGAGSSSLLDDFHAILIAAKSFSGALASIPAGLRTARDDRSRKRRQLGIEGEVGGSYAIIGPLDGRVAGAVFLEKNDFTPFMADAWSAPWIDWSPPESGSEVLRFATRQIDIIRKQMPDATGLDLTVARIGPDRTETRTVPLLL